MFLPVGINAPHGEYIYGVLVNKQKIIEIMFNPDQWSIMWTKLLLFTKFRNLISG